MKPNKVAGISLQNAYAYVLSLNPKPQTLTKLRKRFGPRGGILKLLPGAALRSKVWGNVGPL